MMSTAPSALDYVDEIVAEMGARRLVVFLDYDGTLTPIVSRPEKAVLSNSTRQTLQKLAAQAPVTILSGRDLEDIRHRVGIGGIVYAGSCREGAQGKTCRHSGRIGRAEALLNRCTLSPGQ